MKLEWADYAAVQPSYWNLSGNKLTLNSLKELSAAVVVARWATVDQAWPKEWN